ncbi:hypothetical protein AB8O55_11705 [Saccharopolyspora cebuensis]|uniref:Cas3 C-terminal domain-containing protein n=1 Tax=Saccharopolyspora cebuensis TaxID=418759 RepID=A0ABV4CIW4_9PSEU
MSADALDGLERFDVVLLLPGTPHPTTLDGTPVDLETPGPLEDTQVQALLDSTVQIFLDDLTAASFEVVSALPVPACFGRSGWLHDHHALVLDDAPQNGPVQFHLDEVLGLQIEEEQ